MLYSNHLHRKTVIERPFLILGKNTTGELGYDGPLYDGFLHMTNDMLGPSPMHIKYLSYVYILGSFRTNCDIDVKN